MRSSAGATVLPFPRKVNPAQQADSPDSAPHPCPSMEGGCLALDSLPFEIDEPDPLVISEGRNADLISPLERQEAMQILEGGAQYEPNPRRLRLKDLHLMDVLIILGFLVIAAIL